MPPRRPILVLALLVSGLTVAGLGLRGWSLDGGRASVFAGRALAGYGLRLTALGPVTLTILPLPRLAFERVAVAAAPSGPMLAEGGRLVVDLDPLGLLGGRAAVGGLRLDGARLSPDPDAWAGPLARFAERARAGVPRWLHRITLAGGRVGDGEDARDLDLDLAWPLWSGSAEGRAKLTWRGVPTRITLDHLRPADLAGGGTSPLTAEVTWPDGRLAVDGILTFTDDAPSPKVAGRARFEARSLPQTLAWLGRAAPLAPLAGAVTLEGAFDAAGRTVSWPSLRVGFGGNVLEGAAAVAFAAGDAPRPAIQATLAGDVLNLAPLLGGLVRLSEPGSPPLALGPLTGGDLDLRLSAAAGRFGPVRVDDLAASVLVRETSIEVAVNRARLQNGTFKGRAVLASGADAGETEMRLSGSVDGVDLGGLLGAVGEARWLTGPVQGQFALEGGGRDGADLLAHLGGRATLSVDGGAIAGLDLADVVHRNGTVAPGALARRNGRTAIERAAISLRFADGIGEIAEAALRGPGVGATLRGRVSLPDMRLDARGELALRPPADPARGIAFEVSGPLDALTARAATYSGARGEAADPPGAPVEATLPGSLRLPDQPGLPVGARAYAP